MIPILYWSFASFVAVVVVSYCALVVCMMKPVQKSHRQEAGRHHEL